MSTIKVDKLQGTSGAVTGLTFSGANGTFGGTLAVTGVHTVGNNAVITSEGGAVTTNIAQGSCKAWAHIDGTGTLNVEDSFNMASVTDTSAGTYTPQIANDMNSGSYVVTLAAEIPSTAANNAQRIFSLAAGSYGLQFYEGASPADVDPIVTAVFGDLA